MKFTYSLEARQVLRYALLMACKLDLQPHTRPTDYWLALALAVLAGSTAKLSATRLSGRLAELQQRSLAFVSNVQKKIQYSDVWEGTAPVYFEKHAADILNQTIWQTDETLTLPCLWFVLLYYQPQYFRNELWLPQETLDVIQHMADAGPLLTLPRTGPELRNPPLPAVAPSRYRRHLY